MFAGLQTFKPPVCYISVAGTSTIHVPNTARSTTTDSAGFLERATLWARHCITNPRFYEWRADRGSGYELSFGN